MLTSFLRKKLETIYAGRQVIILLLLLGGFLQVPHQVLAQIVYSGPIEITQGGTYTGNWESLNTEIPAVNIKTTDPVVIINSNIRGAGYLIKGEQPGGVNITIKHTNGYGITPTPWQNYKKPRRFLTVSGFKHVVVENCYMENTAGILLYNYDGNNTTTNTLKVRYNKAKNIDGRVYGGQDNVQFVQLNFNNDNPIKYAEIAWNQVINEPDNSAVEDNISIYNSKGTPDSRIHIHNNYIEGAFPNPRSATSYTGGGITVESPGDQTGNTYEYQSSHILIEQNQLVGIGNSSIGVANGWDIIIRNNKAVNACQYNDTGTRYPYWTHGIYTNNTYLTSQTEIDKMSETDVLVYENVLGIEQTGGNRSEYGSPHGMATYSNNNSISGDITEAMEANEYTLWLQKLSQNGIGIGPNPTPPGNTPNGTITREYWGNVTTESISAIPLATTPDSVTELTLFESPSHVADQYGQRVRGYITAPVTGQYTFWIASDNHSELWLSTSESPGAKVKVADVNGYTSVRQWDKFSSQQSAPVTLQAGQRYYIEALHVEGTAGDNLAVGWQLPNGTYERPIPGNRLSPYISIPPAGKIYREYWAQVYTGSVSGIPVDSPPTTILELASFEAPRDAADNYGQRIRGFVTVPVTGQYRFWIAADDIASLYLSTSEYQDDKTEIASVPSWTDPQQWTKHASQQSALITLQAGQRYYIEALHVEGGSGDHLAVGWQLPNGTYERPIPGSRLSPFDPGMTATTSSAIVQAQGPEMENRDAIVHPNPFNDKITVDFRSTELLQVVLYNQSGQVVHQVSQPKPTGNKLQLDLTGSRIKPGLYILRYTDSSGTSSNIKVIKY